MSSACWLFRTLACGIVCATISVPACADDKAANAATLRPLLETFAKEFVAITPGQGKFPATFQFGPPDATREVRLAGSFSLAKYEVPQNLYEAVMGEEPSRWKGPRNSVEMMSAADAERFCQKITESLRTAGLLKEGEEIRLPTEEEWEYCCRAGTTTRYSFGDEAQRPDDRSPRASLLDKYGWHHGNAAGNDPPVGALAPNPWGLYDMHGYLWEFTSGGPKGKVVVRGGSWKDDFQKLTSSSRKELPADARDDAIGFRCVKAATKPGR
ncbi:MAG TPA: formylglycine-generating enzyme family protein [Planctomycetaceae bacterium]|nr:formylglycine-generating enzyme family protein [Planctomycetaceae bacterium]